MDVDPQAIGGIIAGAIAASGVATAGVVKLMIPKSKGPNGIEQRMARQETKVEGLSKQGDRLDRRLGEVHTRIDEVHERITEQTSVISRIDGRLEGYFRTQR